MGFSFEFDYNLIWQGDAPMNHHPQGACLLRERCLELDFVGAWGVKIQRFL